MGEAVPVYGNPWFSVQAVACTKIISFPYTPLRLRSLRSENQPESGPDRGYTENSSFPYKSSLTVGLVQDLI